MVKKIISLFLCLSMALTLCVPCFASPIAPNDTTEVFAEYTPELEEMTSQEIEELSEAEVEELFIKVFSVSPNAFPEINPYTALGNLSNFYHAYEKITGNSASEISTNSISTKSSYPSYRGEIGVSWKRDFDKSPLSLNEVANNWWTVSVGYSTERQALIIGACKDKATVETLSEFVAGEITALKAEEILNEKYNLKAGELVLATALASFALGAIYDLISTVECNKIWNYALDMRDYQMLKIEYIWTGTSFMFEYAVKTYDYSANYDDNLGRDIFTYRNISNPLPNYYGFWTEDDLGVTP